MVGGLPTKDRGCGGSPSQCPEPPTGPSLSLCDLGLPPQLVPIPSLCRVNSIISFSLPFKVLLSGQPSLAAPAPRRHQVPPLGSHPRSTFDPRGRVTIRLLNWAPSGLQESSWPFSRIWVHIWAPPLTSCGTLGKSLTSLSGLSLLICRMGIIIRDFAD